MNNEKRIFAMVSLGLLLIAFLVPFIIATSGRNDLAVGFSVVAGLLALLFGALGWSDRIGRIVTIAASSVLVVGAGGYTILSQKWGAEAAEPRTAVESAQPESADRR